MALLRRAGTSAKLGLRPGRARGLGGRIWALGLGLVVACGGGSGGPGGDAAIGLGDGASSGDPVLAGDAAEGDAMGGDTMGDASSGGDVAGGDEAMLVFAMRAPRHLALPYVDAGAGTPLAILRVDEVGGAAAPEGLTVRVTGPFAADGDLSALDAFEGRDLEVRYTGDGSVPLLSAGSVEISAGTVTVTTTLAAAVGSAELPAFPGWTNDDAGRYVIVDMPSAPFPHPSAGWTDASVMIALPPERRDDGALGVVLHVHGHNAVLADVVATQRLREQVRASGRNVVWIAPQGPVAAASGNFGKLMDPGGLAALVRDVLTVLYAEGEITRSSFASLTLTSHSGGYAAVAAMLEDGGLPVDRVHLFDSLYAYESTYRDWVLGGGELVSSYTSTGGTDDNNAVLTGMLEGAGRTVATSFDDDTLFAQPLIIGPTTFGHSEHVWARRNYARWLRAAPVAPAPGAPIELLATVAESAGARVSWRDHVLPADAEARYVVRGSWDGDSWEELAVTTDTSATVPARPWLEVAVGPGAAASDRYGATGAEWLVVDGFDRIFGGSYDAPSHPFAATVGAALGGGWSAASNEAVADGTMSLVDFPRVIWLLGDESTLEVTFDARERAAIEAYLDAGGELVVSGSEVGYATSGAWLSATLHAGYVADDAGTTSAGGYTFGVAYQEDYPDVLSGSDVLWTYAGGGGAAAVGYEGRILVVGFPLETLAPSDLGPAMAELVAYLAN